MSFTKWSYRNNASWNYGLVLFEIIELCVLCFQALRKFVQIPCKCHGVSGSCNVKTCWRSLPNFRKVGEHIKEKFDGATEVQYQRIGSKSVLVPRNPEYKPYTKYDLVYLNGSPDFCNADPSTGSLGTQGRFCNRTSQAIEGCAFMCCNRGFTTHLENRVDRCNCKFFWCCYVKCSECHKRVEVSICKWVSSCDTITILLQGKCTRCSVFRLFALWHVLMAVSNKKVQASV